MILLVTGLALAAPPIPTWTRADIESSESDDVEVRQGNAPRVEPRPTSAVVTFEEPPESGHGWADEGALSVDLTCTRGRFHYIIATLRAGGLVAHWRQGPYAGDDVSQTLDIELPPELPGLLTAAGVGRLSLVVATTTTRDEPIGRSRLATTYVRVANGVVVGGVERTEAELSTGGWR